MFEIIVSDVQSVVGSVGNVLVVMCPTICLHGFGKRQVSACGERAAAIRMSAVTWPGLPQSNHASYKRAGSLKP